MKENNLGSWLAETTRRKQLLVVGGVSFLGGLLVGIPAVVIAYVYVGFSKQLTSLLINALGALSTVLLVGVTFATFIENQMRTERDSQRPLVRAELQEVVQPSISRLKANCDTLSENTVRWSRFDSELWRERELTGFELERLFGRQNDDREAFKRFSDRDPTIAPQFLEHDERVRQLGSKGATLVDTLAEPFERYMEENNFGLRYDDLPDGERVALYVLSDVEELPDMNTDQKIWAQEKDAFREAADDIAPEAMAEFREMKRGYLKLVESLEDKLRTTRGRLEQKYGVSLNDDAKHENHELPERFDSGYSGT